VRFPAVAAGMIAGIATSFMALTLAGVGRNWEGFANKIKVTVLVLLRTCQREAFPQS
jgi:hypothetical protein